MGELSTMRAVSNGLLGGDRGRVNKTNNDALETVYEYMAIVYSRLRLSQNIYADSDIKFSYSSFSVLCYPRFPRIFKLYAIVSQGNRMKVKYPF